MSTEIVNKHVVKIPERLVAPIEKQNVPNHLLNTSNIFIYIWTYASIIYSFILL